MRDLHQGPQVLDMQAHRPPSLRDQEEGQAHHPVLPLQGAPQNEAGPRQVQLCRKGRHLAEERSLPTLGNGVVPERAAFPHGLPEAMKEAMAANDHTSSEASLSDSERSDSALGCICGFAGDCSCCTPRKASAHRDSTSKRALSSTPPVATHTQLNELARARYRALRPAPAPALPQSTISHNPSSPVLHKFSHHHPENMFNPYPRPGYGHDFSHEYAAPQPQSSGVASDFNRSLQSNPHQWGTMAGSPYLGLPLSNCGCGEACQCPGCAHHRGFHVLPLPSAFLSCSNPSTCISCLDCTILSLPPPTDGVMSYEQDALNELIRQIEQANPSLDGNRWTGFQLSNDALDARDVNPRGINASNDDQNTAASSHFADPSDWSDPQTLQSTYSPLGSLPPIAFENLDTQSTNSLTSLDIYDPLFDITRSSTKPDPSAGGILDLDQDTSAPSTGSGRTGIPLSRYSTITQHHFQSTPNLAIRSDMQNSCCSSGSTPSNTPSPHPQSDSGVDYDDLDRTRPYDSSLTDMRIF